MIKSSSFLIIPFLLVQYAQTPQTTKVSQITLDKTSFLKDSKEMRNISVVYDGTLKVSSQIKSADIRQIDVASSFVSVKDGYLIGTGEGKIFNISRSGAMTQEFNSSELIITSMVQFGESIIASSIPQGKLFTRSSEGSWKQFCKLPSEYVWKLNVSGGKLYAACGLKATVYLVDPDGSYKKLIESNKVSNFISILIEGINLWLGSSDGGHFYRGSLNAPDDLDLVATFPQSDVVDIAKFEELYIVTNKTGDWRKSTETIAPALKKEGTGTVWKLSGGVASPVISFPVFINDITATEEGILIGLNSSGKIFMLDGKGESQLIVDAQTGSITNLSYENKHTVFTGSGRSIIGMLDNQIADDGTYITKIFDSGCVSRWGAVEVQAEGKIEVQVRTGNTSTPDEDWSDWSFASTERTAGLNISTGRFAQIRARLHGEDAHLKAVSVSYKNLNRAPVVESFDIKLVESGQTKNLNFNWKATDADNNPIVYSIYYKLAENKKWILLEGSHSLSATTFTAKPSMLPEGKLEFMVKASDSAANSAEDAMEGTFTISTTIDHSGPAVSFDLSGSEISGYTSDAISPVTALAYQIDGGVWVPFTSSDSMLDSQKEEFKLTVKTDGLASGNHRLVVKATDNYNNSTLVGRILVVK